MPLVTFDDRNVSSGKTVLYSGGTYTTTSVSLSDTSANYDILHIMFINNDGITCSESVYNPDGKKVCAWAYSAGATNAYAKGANFEISGTSISNYQTQKQHVMGGSSITTTQQQNVGIYAVIGEKL